MQFVNKKSLVFPRQEEEKQTFQYNEYDGYRPNPTKTGLSAPLYDCRSNGTRRYFYPKSSSQMLNSRFLIPKPTITSKTDGYGIIGKKLELNCAIQSNEVLNNLNLTWIMPNSNAAETVKK